MVLRLKQNNAKASRSYDDDYDSQDGNFDEICDLEGSSSKSWRSRRILSNPTSTNSCQNNPNVSIDNSRMGTTFSFYNAFHRIMKIFRRAITGVRFVDLDPEVCELPTPRYKPECIENLCKCTNFTRKELQTIYRSFKQACPTGLASESLLQDMYSQFFPHGDSSLYAHFVFKTFDQDGNGSLSFEEFVVGLSSLSRGTLEQKLQWAFNLYDINGDGCITRDELNEIVGSIYSLMGKDATLLMDDQTPKEHVERVFKKMDLNEDGVVTIEEFMEICQKDDSIRRSITALDTVL